MTMLMMLLRILPTKPPRGLQGQGQGKECASSKPSCPSPPTGCKASNRLCAGATGQGVKRGCELRRAVDAASTIAAAIAPPIPACRLGRFCEIFSAESSGEDKRRIQQLNRQGLQGRGQEKGFQWRGIFPAAGASDGSRVQTATGAPRHARCARHRRQRGSDDSSAVGGLSR